MSYDPPLQHDPIGPPVPAPQRGPAPTDAAGWARRLFAPAIAVIIGLVKFGAKLKLLLLFITKAKFLATSLSMVASVGAYTLFWGWQFAVLFVLLMLVHEWGHALQMRREGIAATPILFVPFLGAVIGMKNMPRNAWVEAKVGLAGPVVGTLGAAAVLGLGVAIDSDLLRAAGYTGFLLNLFNLLPIVPLDGGRAAAALHPAVWVVGLAGLGALLFVSPNPILILILLVGALEAWRRWRARKAGEDLDYYHVEPMQRVAVGVTFFTVAAACVLGMSVSQVDV